MSNNYPIEPLDSEVFEQLKDDYNFKDLSVDETARLVETFALYIVCDKSKDFELSKEQLEQLCINLINICKMIIACKEITNGKLIEVYKERKHYFPDWEICSGCNKRYSFKCNPDECNPMDI